MLLGCICRRSVFIWQLKISVMNIVNIEITPPIPVSSNAHGKSYKESITESIKSLPTSAEGAIAHPPGTMINIFYKIVKST